MLLAVRVLRLLRVFRVLKLTRYTTATRLLIAAIRESRPKIIVFLWGVVSAVIIVGSVIYLVEGPENGFTSIPMSIYWAVVTMTTVGYGDIVPQTSFGQFLAMLMMIGGYAFIAVPTGIMTVELSNLSHTQDFTRCCPFCAKEGHESRPPDIASLEFVRFWGLAESALPMRTGDWPSKKGTGFRGHLKAIFTNPLV